MKVKNEGNPMVDMNIIIKHVLGSILADPGTPKRIRVPIGQIQGHPRV